MRAQGANSDSPARGVLVDELVSRHRARLQNPDYEEWIIEGLLRAAALGVLIGSPKAGKTSLARCISMAVAGGEKSCLGRRTVRGPVIFIELDEPEITVARHYAQILVPGAKLYHYQDYGARTLPPSADERLHWLAQWSREIRAVLIVIDTAFRFLAVRQSITIADYGAMHAMMSRFQTLVFESGASALLLHHAPKTHGPLSPLGSQAIGGAVDSVLTVIRDAGGRRYLEVDGRDVSMPSTRLDISEGRISLDQFRHAEAAQHDTRARLLAAVKAHPGELTCTDATKKARVRKEDGLRLLEQMELEGEVCSKPREGRRGRTLWPAHGNGSGFPS